jgi:hypothetical protein
VTAFSFIDRQAPRSGLVTLGRIDATDELLLPPSSRAPRFDFPIPGSAIRFINRKLCIFCHGGFESPLWIEAEDHAIPRRLKGVAVWP